MSEGWYKRNEMKVIGPFSLSEIHFQLQRGEISPEDFLWKDGEAEWRPALSWPENSKVQPPAFQFIEESSASEGRWVVLQKVEGGYRSHGPYRHEEIVQQLAQKTLSPFDHVWRPGMTGWARIQSRPDF